MPLLLAGRMPASHDWWPDDRNRQSHSFIADLAVRVSPRSPAQPPGPRAGRPQQPLPAYSPGRDEPAFPAILVHLGYGLAHLHALRDRGRHRHCPDVLLPAGGRARPCRYAGPAIGGLLRADAGDPSLGCPRDGHHGVAAHAAGFHDRQLQAATRVQLVHRRLSARADHAAFVHRLSAALGSTGHVGGHGGHQHGGGSTANREGGSGFRLAADELGPQVASAGRRHRRAGLLAAVLRPALRGVACRFGRPHLPAPLANPQGWRPQRTPRLAACPKDHSRDEIDDTRGCPGRSGDPAPVGGFGLVDRP